MQGADANVEEYDKAMGAMQAQAMVAKAVLFDAARDGGVYISNRENRIESMRKKARGTILENVSDNVLECGAGQLEKYHRTYEEEPDIGLYSNVIQGAETIVNEFDLGAGGSLPSGKILEAVATEQGAGNLSTTEGNMLVEHALMMVTTVPLETITSHLTTTMPAAKDKEVIFRLHNIVKKDAGNMKAGDRIDATFNGRLGHSRQTYDFPTVTDGAAITYTFTPETDAPLGRAVATKKGQTAVYLDGAMIASDMNGSFTGDVTIGGTLYTLSGTVANATGVITLNSTPALPSGKQLKAKYCLDYEKAPELIAQIDQELTKHTLTPEWWALQADITLQSILGFRREHGKDLNAHSIAVMRNLHAAELDRMRLQEMRDAAQYHDTFDSAAPGSDSNNQHLSNAQHYQVLQETLTRMDRNIMQGTQVTGMAGMVCGSMAAEIVPFLHNFTPVKTPMPRSPQPRYLGRLGAWKVFEDPNADQGDILCAGKGRNYGQSGYLTGVAIPPMHLKHSMTEKLRQTDTMLGLTYDTLHPDDGQKYFGRVQVS